MKKILLVMLLNFTYLLYSKEIVFFNTVKLNFPEDVSIKKYHELISINNDVIFVQNQYVVKFKNYDNLCEIIFKIKANKGIDENHIKNFLKIKEIRYTNFEFDSHVIVLKGDKNHVIINDFKTNSGIKVNRYLSDLGTHIASDYLIYNFKFNHEIFNECSITFTDIWNSTGIKLSVNMLRDKFNELQQNYRGKLYIYDLLENVIKNVEILKYDKNVYIKENTEIYEREKPVKSEKPPDKYYVTIKDNVELKEGPFEEDKTIRLLKKGEQLILIDPLDYGENISYGQAGTWKMVKTKKGEIGFCFDIFLEEIK